MRFPWELLFVLISLYSDYMKVSARIRVKLRVRLAESIVVTCMGTHAGGRLI